MQGKKLQISPLQELATLPNIRENTVNCCLSSSKGVLGQLISGGLKKTEYKIVDQNKL